MSLTLYYAGMHSSKTTKQLLAGLALLATVTVVGLLAVPRAATPRTLQITASFYPMAEFARQVAGNRATVHTLIGPGVEPHDYEPTPKDIAQIYKSSVLVYNGAGLEPWITKIGKEAQANGVTLAETSKGINLLAKDPAAEGNSPTDPHIWMDPVLAIQQVASIKAALVKADPAGRPTYEANAASYTKQLEQLDTQFRNGLAQCQLRDIVTSHQAFAYLAQRYNLRALAISGLSPDDEPSPQELAAAANFAQSHRITHIFFETLVSPKLSQTIAKEVGAQTIVFNPLEGLTQDEIKSGKNYLTVQQANLQALQIALHCKQDATTY